MRRVESVPCLTPVDLWDMRSPGDAKNRPEGRLTVS